MSSNFSKRVAVLRGGKNHFHSSLKTGEFILKHMPEGFEAVDVFVDDMGVWHNKGLPKKPENILFKIDFLWNSLYDRFDEENSLYRLLENFHIKHTSSTPFSSALSLHKNLSKNLFKKFDIKTPHHIVVNKETMDSKKLYEIFTTFPHPAIVKPENLDHSIGVSLVTNQKELKNAIDKVFALSDDAILEEYIKGREFFVAICDNFRGKDHYIFPIIEIGKYGRDIFDEELKQASFNDVFYASISDSIRKEIEKNALNAYKLSTVKNFAGIDIIFHPKRGVFVLEVNTQPQISDFSPFSFAMHNAGCHPRDFISSVLKNHGLF